MTTEKKTDAQTFAETLTEAVIRNKDDALRVVICAMKGAERTAPDVISSWTKLDKIAFTVRYAFEMGAAAAYQFQRLEDPQNATSAAHTVE